ncbi:PDZ domain-containing protein [Patescibacteria group bacterium AH-259-L05]|nr:PDZ domain-containing protein [Patescibacteria group bacterium AH-259-L05]
MRKTSLGLAVIVLLLIGFGSVSAQVNPGYLGVQYRIMDDSTSKAIGLEDLVIGAFILEVVPGASADKVGLVVGDIILAVDGVQIDSLDRLKDEIKKHTAGDSVELKVLRSGALSIMDAEVPLRYEAVINVELAGWYSYVPRFGVYYVSTLDGAEIVDAPYRTAPPSLTLAPASSDDEPGLQVGDRVVEVDEVAIEVYGQLTEVFEKYNLGDTVQLKVDRTVARFEERSEGLFLILETKPFVINVVVSEYTEQD